MKINVYRMLFNLPEGMAINVDLKDIEDQIKRDLFTGIDLMGGLRKDDIQGWLDNTAKNHKMNIVWDEMSGTIKFYKPKEEK